MKTSCFYGVVSIIYSAAVRRKSYSNNNKKTHQWWPVLFLGEWNWTVRQRMNGGLRGLQGLIFGDLSRQLLLKPRYDSFWSILASLFLLPLALHAVQGQTEQTLPCTACIIHDELKIPLPPDMKW